MLWIGDLTNLEKLAMASFVTHGHPVHLYTYSDLEGVPAGVEVLDANTILPEGRIFRYGPAAGISASSIAPFSDVFRYELLHQKGGWWIDADVVCLRPFDFDAPYVFGYEDATTIAGGVLRLPAGSAIAATLYERAVALGSNTQYGSTGPKLLTDVVEAAGLQAYALPPGAFYPVHYLFAEVLLKADSKTGMIEGYLRGSYCVHFWNEVLRRRGLDKNATYPDRSIFEQLKARYGVASK
jgi:hypothetical protein